jgi:hypothetical protein
MALIAASIWSLYFNLISILYCCMDGFEIKVSSIVSLFLFIEKKVSLFLIFQSVQARAAKVNQTIRRKLEPEIP